MRRVYLDLVGLPPTREEVHAFLNDPSDDAYEKVVEQLLARPQYGERWGRHWMDVWRYSDWYGRRNQNDVRNSFPQIWRWRDWIVGSLNDDLLGFAQPGGEAGIAVPAGATQVRLSFWHRYEFDEDRDGGLIAVSLDGQTYYFAASAQISGRGYNGTVDDASVMKG